MKIVETWYFQIWVNFGRALLSLCAIKIEDRPTYAYYGLIQRRATGGPPHTHTSWKIASGKFEND